MESSSGKQAEECRDREHGATKADPAGLGAPERAPRRLRADAQRNIGSLLAAAKAVFGTSGVDAPAKEIADLAGVGVGTLYRHFPQRSDLVKAVLQHEIDARADAAPALAAVHEPGIALAKWLHRYTEFLTTKRGFATALHSGDPAFDALPGYFFQRLEPALGSLLDAAAAAARSVPTSAPATCCAPSPCCARPYRTRESHTAGAWSPSSSTDCATPPNFGGPPPKVSRAATPGHVRGVGMVTAREAATCPARSCMTPSEPLTP